MIFSISKLRYREAYSSVRGHIEQRLGEGYWAGESKPSGSMNEVKVKLHIGSSDVLSC